MIVKWQSKYSYFLYTGKNHDVFDDLKQYLLIISQCLQVRSGTL